MYNSYLRKSIQSPRRRTGGVLAAQLLADKGEALEAVARLLPGGGRHARTRMGDVADTCRFCCCCVVAAGAEPPERRLEAAAAAATARLMVLLRTMG